MYIESVQLKNFRNYDSLELDLALVILPYNKSFIAKLLS